MNKLITIAGFSLILLLFLSSCTGDEFDTSSEMEVEVSPEVITTSRTAESLINRTLKSSDAGFDEEEGWGDDCGRTLYPFSLIDSDGTTYDIATEQDLIDIYESFDNDSVADDFFIDFVYPINVLNSSGETESINNADEFYDLYLTCAPEGGWEDGYFPAYSISEENSCLEAVFPFNLKDIDGDIVTINNEDELSIAIEEDELFFAFPLDLLLDGTLVTATTLDELIGFLLSCNSFEELDLALVGCYDLEFPFSVLLTDGSTVEIGDQEEYSSILIKGTFDNYVYPITLISLEGESLEVNSEEELFEALNDCVQFEVTEDFLILLLLAYSEPIDPSDPNSGCFNITYPINATTQQDGEGDAIVYNSAEEVFSFYEGQEFENLLYPIYPINITLNPGNEAVQINSIDDFLKIGEICRD